MLTETEFWPRRPSVPLSYAWKTSATLQSRRRKQQFVSTSLMIGSCKLQSPQAIYGWWLMFWNMRPEAVQRYASGQGRFGKAAFLRHDPCLFWPLIVLSCCRWCPGESCLLYQPGSHRQNRSRSQPISRPFCPPFAARTRCLGQKACIGALHEIRLHDSLQLDTDASGA